MMFLVKKRYHLGKEPFLKALVSLRCCRGRGTWYLFLWGAKYVCSKPWRVLTV